MIKLIVFDLDHTLLNSEKEISPFTFEILNKIKSMGIQITLASGRAEPLMIPYVKALNIDIPVLVNNGSLIKDFNRQVVLFDALLNQAAQNHILKEALDANISFILYVENQFYLNHENRTFFYDDWNMRYPDATIDLKITSDFEILKQIHAYKLLLIIHDEVQFDYYYERYKDRDDVHVTKSQDTFLDILPKGTNKGQGLKHLAKHLQIGLDEIMTFGDNDNDAEMLTLSGLSVAMPNGSKKAMAAAQFVAPYSNDEEGVAKTLDLFIKNKILVPIS